MKPREILDAYRQGGGTAGQHAFPAINATVHQTNKGTRYLKEPGAVVVAKTSVSLWALAEFLGGFDEDLQFRSYLDDPPGWEVVDVVAEGGQAGCSRDPAYELPEPLPDGAHLVKIAGQLCYLSFSPERTKNADTVKYVHNLVSSGHGSVLEHPNVSLLFYGISRSLTHELVRHRAGCGYSQVSQRYVDGSRLRFVERPEYQNDPELHRRFEDEIDRQAALYEETAGLLLDRQKQGEDLLSGGARRDRRKKVNQAARSVLGNHVEAPIVMTANVRAWRHILSMRASVHAEVEIRRALFRAFLCLAMVDPTLFGDFEAVTFSDGTKGVTTPYPKV